MKDMGKLPPIVRKLPRVARRVLGWGFLSIVFLALIISAIALASRGPACGGGYPEKWCKRSLDSVVDDWGMYNRECVSYTAYRVALSGRRMPYGFGDANRWPMAAKMSGIAVDYSPRAGDVAIRMDNNHGHSMYIEWINDDGTLHVSEYNKNKNGTYIEEDSTRDGLVFVHF
jgi:surface antigen